MTGSAKKDYDVGYGRPPAERQFSKGRSGNPRGRPRGSRSLKSQIEDELKQKISIRENGREKKLAKGQILTKTLVAKAIGGDLKAFEMIVRYCKSMHEDDRGDDERLNETERRLVDDFLKNRKNGSDT